MSGLPENGPDLNQLARDRLERPLPKRFYKTVAVEEGEGGYRLTLDGRPVRTPLKNRLDMPSRALADAVAGEWDAQDETIDPAAMPLTRLANTALDRVAPDPGRIVGEIADYAGTDLLCYRADAPDGLVERQNAVWDPLLSWGARAIGARFVATVGIVHQPQPDASLQAVRDHLMARDAFTLTSIHNATTLTGSAIIALALEASEIAPDEAWSAAHVDEDWQIGLWGRDAEAEARRAARQAEFDAAAHLLALLGERRG